MAAFRAGGTASSVKIDSQGNIEPINNMVVAGTATVGTLVITGAASGPIGAAALQTTGASVDVAAAAPPVATQVLTATSATTATWQTPATAAAALQTTGADVNVSAAAPPTTGQLLKATSATTATWQAAAADELSTTGTAVNVAASAPPAAGDSLVATSATTATWQPASAGYAHWRNITGVAMSFNSLEAIAVGQAPTTTLSTTGVTVGALGEMTINVDGVYHVTAWYIAEITGTTARFMVDVFLNSALVFGVDGVSHDYEWSSNQGVASLPKRTFDYVFSASAGDVLELAVQNGIAAARTCNLIAYSFSVVRIG